MLTGRTNEQRTVFAASLISASSAAIFLIMPLFIGVFIDELSLSSERAGFLASTYFAGYLGVCLTALVWIRRVNWKTLSALGHVFLIGSILSVAFTSDYPTMLTLFFLAGCGGGILFSLCICILGETSNPDRSFGFKLGTEQVVGATLLFLLPSLVISKWGYSGFCITLAIVFALLSSSTLWLPTRSSASSRNDSFTANDMGNKAIWIGLFCLMLFMTGLSGVWAFIERMASDSGIEAVNIGRALSFGVVGGGCGAFMAAIFGNRFGRTLPLLIALILLSIVLYALNGQFSMTVFVPVCIALSGMWNFSLAYQMAIVASVDKNGGMAVLMSSALALGAVIGPAMAGMMIQGESYLHVNFFAFISILVASLIFLNLERKATT